MPQLGESVAEGTIGKWLKQPGDHVAKYEPLLEVITDKVNAEVPSPYEGVLKEILVEEGATVPNNAEIAVIEEAGAAASTMAASAPAATAAASSGSTSTSTSTAPTAQPAPTPPAAPDAEPAPTNAEPAPTPESPAPAPAASAPAAASTAPSV